MRRKRMKEGVSISVPWELDRKIEEKVEKINKK